MADVLNNSLRTIASTGIVSTPIVFPTGFEVSALALINQLEFYGTQTIGSHRIIHITSLQDITSFAGIGTPGFNDGPNTQAEFNNPSSIIAHQDFYSDAQEVTIFVADALNNRSRKIVGE